jgi:quercetin dioxygenase-like cupin family protein
VPILNWNALPAEEMNPLLRRKVIHTAGMTVAALELKKGAVVPRHAHPNEQVSIMQSGAMRFDFLDESVTVHAGDVVVIAPERPHGVEVLEDSTVLDLFTPPREDWRRGDDAYLR